MRYFNDNQAICVNMLPRGELIMNASFPKTDKSCRIVKTYYNKIGK